MYAGSPAQSSTICSPGFLGMCIVARCLCSSLQMYSHNQEYMSCVSPAWRHSSQYSIHISFFVTPFRNNSLWMHPQLGRRRSVTDLSLGNKSSSKATSDMPKSSYYEICISCALSITRLTILHVILQPFAMFRLQNPRLFTVIITTSGLRKDGLQVGTVSTGLALAIKDALGISSRRRQTVFK